MTIAAAAAVVCFYARRRFTALLVRAELLAEQATCQSCLVYGKLDVVIGRRRARERSLPQMLLRMGARL